MTLFFDGKEATTGNTSAVRQDEVPKTANDGRSLMETRRGQAVILSVTDCSNLAVVKNFFVDSLSSLD